MIGHLRGKVISKKPGRVLIDVQGVGYDVVVPSSYLSKPITVSGEVSFFVYTHVREDQLQLYGFFTEGEKDLFQVLLSISGIGPKVALTLLSEISPKELGQVVLTNNVNRLTSIQGIGKKTAERLVLEMKEKIRKISAVIYATDFPEKSDVVMDLSSALSNLGYKQIEIDRALGQLNLNHTEKFEDLLKQTLKILRA